MKRKDFLRKMRSRRRRDEIELREPERRRAIDWRTHRVELPMAGEPDVEESLAVGLVRLSAAGVTMQATQNCWVRGYRLWQDDDRRRAEFQYRPMDAAAPAPPGATALQPDELWEPAG